MMQRLILFGLICLLLPACTAKSVRQAETATAVPTLTPTAPPTTALQEALEDIMEQFEIDTKVGCLKISNVYSEYHKGLQQMTVLLLTDPRAQALSFAEREALFEKVVGGVGGWTGVRFIAGNGEATLVALQRNLGIDASCSGHYDPRDALYVVDQQGIIYDLGAIGSLERAWWVDDRWIMFGIIYHKNARGKIPIGIWHIGQIDGVWQRLVDFEFIPPPSYLGSESLPIRFEEGYQVMIADLDYSGRDDPCEFTREFRYTYAHVMWQMRNTYQLVSNTYELASSEMLTVKFQRKDTGEQVAINWQEHCVDPSLSQKKIAFVSDRQGNQDIYLIASDGSYETLLAITNDPANDTSPAWSPDGRLIAFVSDRDGDNDLYVMKADGSDVRQLLDDPADDLHPSWLPDGDHIAFTSDRDGGYNIYALDVNELTVVQLTTKGGWAPASPALRAGASGSLDDQRILFVSDQDGNQYPFPTICIMDADGSNIAQLTHAAPNDGWPAWSPDGSRIAYVTGDGQNIALMDADGSNKILLTDHPATDFYPTWSPDGRQIAFASIREQDVEIFSLAVFCLDTPTGCDGHWLQLTNNEANDTEPAWQP